MMPAEFAVLLITSVPVSSYINTSVNPVVFNVNVSLVAPTIILCTDPCNVSVCCTLISSPSGTTIHSYVGHA